MKNIKKLNIVIIITVLIFYPLSQVRAGVPIIDTAQFSKEFGLDPIAKAIAQSLLKASTNFLVRKISSSGRGGGPAFVQDWRSFILGGQYRGEDIWRGILYTAANGNSNLGLPPLLCDHIRNSSAFKSFQPREVPNLIQSGLNRRADSLQEYLVTTKCDPVVNSRFDTFMEDFSAGGGWETWEKMLQPQNNIFGATELALKELNKQRSIEEKADVSEAIAGKGFTSIRAGCVAREPLPPDFVGPPDPSKRCTIFGKVVTPADTIGKSAAAAIDANTKLLVTADEINEVIVVLIGALLDRTFSEVGLAQGSDIQGQTLPSQPIPSIPQTPSCQVDPVDGTITCNGDGGGGVCSDQGGSEDYAGNLGAAEDAVIAENPNGIADALNTWGNSLSFLNYVAEKLQSAGFNATTDVLNGNDNSNRGDLIAVWRSGDSTIERYDAVHNAGVGNSPMRKEAATDFTGDIPLSCIE